MVLDDEIRFIKYLLFSILIQSNKNPLFYEVLTIINFLLDIVLNYMMKFMNILFFFILIRLVVDAFMCIYVTFDILFNYMIENDYNIPYHIKIERNMKKKFKMGEVSDSDLLRPSLTSFLVLLLFIRQTSDTSSILTFNIYISPPTFSFLSLPLGR
jgi:hypothetical protein